VIMGKMWVGFYILCFCFMVLSNSPTYCDSPRRLGSPERGILTNNFGKGFGDVETKKLLRAAENSLRIGSVKESNIRLGIHSTKTVGLDYRELGLVHGRFLGENVARIETRGDLVNATRKRKRTGIDRREKKHVKQIFRKGKGVHNYNTQKEKQGRKSVGAKDVFKDQEEHSKVSQPQSGMNGRKQENTNAEMPENRVNPSEIEGESKGNELRSRVRVKRLVAKLMRKNESKEEEENPNFVIEVNKETDGAGDDKEEYESKGLQNGVKGKRAVSNSIHKIVKEEEEAGPNAIIQ
ncbi:hypothetical protein KI387_006632, partial [Taxus chinensis]